MATAVAPSLLARPAARAERLRRALIVPTLISVLTGFALLVHGYHPYAEDGGLYLTGAKHLLHPALFPANLAFVTAHLRYSLFAPAMAAATRFSHLPFDAVVLLAYVASLWTTIYSVWALASRCFASLRERVSAVLLVAAWLTLPVAGTSLILVDPYLTARSISTPAVLLLLAGTLDLSVWRRGGELPRRSHGLSLAAGTLALAFHPLMAAYGLICAGVILLLGDNRLRPKRRAVLLCVLSAGVFLAAWLLTCAAPAESSSYRQAALTRAYWFLSEWRWYEVIGFAAPLAILAVTLRLPFTEALRRLARATLIAALAGALLALSFARIGAPSLAVARLQPLRVLQIAYVVVLIVLGGTLGRLLLRDRWWRYALAAPLLAVPLYMAARTTFPASPQIELGWALGRSQPSANAWVKAFRWVRANTTPDALFALDADYITRRGEDAQSFRAIAERSVLPDAAKDGGEASITPALADLWARGEEAQSHLSAEDDVERLRHLRPLGVDWVLIESSSRTAFPCAYDNGTVKVCRVPTRP